MNENKSKTENRWKGAWQGICKYGKFVVVLAIVAFMVFIVQSKKEFAEDVAFRPSGTMEETVSLADGDVLTQKFQAQSDTIERLQFFVEQNQGENRGGSIEVSIKDAKGNKIYNITTSMLSIDGRSGETATLSMQGVGKNHWWNMVVNQKLKKGETYTYQLKAVGVSKKTPLNIHRSMDKKDSLGTCTVNGKKIENKVCVRVWSTQIDKTAIALALAICIALIILVLVPVKIPEKWNKIASWGFFAISPWLVFYMVEKIFYNPISIMKPWAFGLNVAWYYALFALLLLIFNRTKFAIIIGTLLMYGCGVAQYLTLMYRGTPITPSDFYALGTAMDVADHYTLTLNKAAIIATVVMIGICIIAWKMQAFKALNGKKKRFIELVIVAALIAGSTFASMQTDFLADQHVQVNFFNQRKGYRTNGFVLSFMMNAKYVMGTEPDGYSTSKVKEIVKGKKTVNGENKSLKQKPNVVVIMNETLSDLSVVNKIKTNKEVFPYLNSLKKNTIKGHMLMSVFGGGTSNSEYEFLTGNSVSSLPLSGNAYTQYVKHETPSLASQLKEQGYSTVAFHPYLSTAWNRESVYPLLGFDKFLTMDDMDPNASKLRGWYTDSADYDKIIETFEKKKKNQPMFFFNVTIQNHGGYYIPDANFKEQIKITDEKKMDSANRYESLMYESDQAFKKIVNYFSKQSEPTIVVLFGDHQPKLEDDFYELLYGKSLNSLSLKELQKKYTVPFFIWANYDIKEKDNVYTSANYLSSMMLEQTNLKLTPYNQYLLELAKEVPAINANGYVDTSGKNYSLEAKSKYTNAINNYKMLQYNNLFDYKNRDESLFSTK